MRELKWAASGRRRDQWDRWGQLLSLVDNRTKFGKDAKPSRPLDWWPDGLLTKADIAAVKAAEKQHVIKADITALKVFLGVTK